MIGWVARRAAYRLGWRARWSPFHYTPRRVVRRRVVRSVRRYVRGRR